MWVSTVPRVPRIALLACALTAAAAVAAVTVAAAWPDGRGSYSPASQAALASGTARYAAYVRAELASLEDRRRVGDRAGAAIHEARLAPLGDATARDIDPFAVNRRAAELLEEEAEAPGADAEHRVAGAFAAFEAIRDALWRGRRKVLVGRIDERFAAARARPRDPRALRRLATLLARAEPERR
jgi:hypothetical protein